MGRLMNLTFIEKAIDEGFQLKIRPWHEGGFEAELVKRAVDYHGIGTTIVEALARLEHYVANL